MFIRFLFPLCMLAVFAGHAVPAAEEAAETASEGPPNVILVCIDTLRADHLGVYGYERPTSPHIDRFAEDAWLFEQAVAPSSFTRESIAALFTAQFPSRSEWTSGWSAAPPAGAPVLPKWFRDAGYHTALFANNPVLEGLTFYEGFDTAECHVLEWGISGVDHALSGRVLEYLGERDDDAPFFLYVHYMDPHGPYNPALPFLQRMSGPRTDTPLSLYDDVRPDLPRLLEEGFGPDDDRFKDLVVRYDAEIATADDAFGKLLAGLEEQGLMENTLIVLFADHGEEFLEHGFVEHAWRVFTESVHVPLIVRFPGVLGAARIDAPVSLVDVGPTVAALAGVAPQGGRLDGKPLAARTGEAWEPVARPLPFVTELCIQTRCVVRALYTEDRVYIASQRWLTPEQCSEVAKTHLGLVREFEQGNFPVVTLDAPFDWEALYAFPGPQQENLLEKEPETAAKLRMLMRAYLSVCPEPLSEPERIAARHQDDDVDREALEEQLQSLGYLGN